MLGGNVVWEALEVIFLGEAGKHGGLTGYVQDTINDMAAVIQGYDSGISDCDFGFVPAGCTPKTPTSKK